jgi:hypothetical protein
MIPNKSIDPGVPLGIILGLLGAAVGGFIGYFAFFWIARQGFYAPLVPPSVLGLVAGLASRRRSVLLAVICGIGGLALGLFTEWKFAPFFADGSFIYFLTHILSLRPITLFLLALGTFLSYRFALGFSRKSRRLSDAS